MKYVAKRRTKTISAVQVGHIQHSKKIATWSLIQWVVIALAVTAVLFFADWTEPEAEVLGSVITWSATLAGIAVTAYMGNSAIEKYSNSKFSITGTIDGDG